MHISARTLFSNADASPTLRTGKRRSEDGDIYDIRRVSERPDDTRRQSPGWRRSSKPAPRARDPEDRAANGSSARRPAAVSQDQKSETGVLPPRLLDFWSLLSAVTPDGSSSHASAIPGKMALDPNPPSLDDLFARVIAAG